MKALRCGAAKAIGKMGGGDQGHNSEDKGMVRHI